jgi:hypothetical protein
MSLMERVTQAQMNDDEQNLIADRRSVAAAPKIQGFVKSKMVLTRPTELLIQKYNIQNQQVPVSIVNPDTGEVKNFKFHPVEVSPEYELEEPIEVQDITNQKATENFRAQKRINEITIILPELPAAIQEVDDVLRDIDGAQSNADLRQIAQDIGISPSTMIQHTAEVRQGIEAERTRLVDKLRQLTDESPYLEHIIQENERDIEDIRAENERIQHSNKQKNLMYFNELNRLNSGSFNMSQLPYESDEQYQQRLIDHSQIEAPEQVLYDASIFIKKDFRNHIRNLLNDESQIESVTNSFTAEELNNILSKWPQFEKNFLEIFGRNNEYVSLTDLVDFFKNPTTSTEFSAKLKPSAPRGIPSGDNFVSFVSEPGLLNIINNTTGLSLQLRLTPDNKKIKFGINNEGEIELPTKKRVNLIRQLVGDIGLSIDEFLKAIQSHPDDLKNMSAMIRNIHMRYPDWESVPELEPELEPEPPLMKVAKRLTKEQERELMKQIEQEKERRQLEEEAALIPKSRKQKQKMKAMKGNGPSIGYGIKNEELNNKQIQFGNLEINGNKLWNEHILAVRSKGYMVHNMPSTKISNEFVEIIIRILKDGKVTEHEIKGLKLGERQLYDLLLEKAKIIKELPNTKTKTIDELKQRLEILQGEYEAGNTNDELLTELIKLAKKLHILKAITGTQLREFVGQFL